MMPISLRVFVLMYRMLFEEKLYVQYSYGILTMEKVYWCAFLIISFSVMKSNRFYLSGF